MHGLCHPVTPEVVALTPREVVDTIDHIQARRRDAAVEEIAHDAVAGGQPLTGPPVCCGHSTVFSDSC
jgi:hypothetical protein